MANELCVTFSGVSHQFQLMSVDHWSDGNYWIYRDSFYWMISTSEFRYGTGRLLARKAYTSGSWVDGYYYGVDGNPDVVIELGICESSSSSSSLSSSSTSSSSFSSSSTSSISSSSLSSSSVSSSTSSSSSSLSSSSISSISSPSSESSSTSSSSESSPSSISSISSSSDSFSSDSSSSVSSESSSISSESSSSISSESSSTSSSSSSLSSFGISSSSSSSSSGWFLGANNVLWYSATQNGDVSAGGTVTDYGPAGNDGSLIDNAYVEGDGVNKGIVLDGNGDYVTVGVVNLSGSAITISAWIYANSWKLTSPYISHVAGIEDLSVPASAFIRFGDSGLLYNKLQFVLDFGGSQQRLNGNATFNTGQWYHVAATYNGSTMTIYKNAVVDNYTNAYSGNFNANGNLWIANAFSSPDRYFNGILDEVMIWKRCLSQTEITHLYNNQYKK